MRESDPKSSVSARVRAPAGLGESPNVWLLSKGRSHHEILEELPDLEEDNQGASIRYARKRMDQPALAS